MNSLLSKQEIKSISTRPGIIFKLTFLLIGSLLYLGFVAVRTTPASDSAPLSEPLRIEGTGTNFFLPNPDYLDIYLTSSEVVTLTMESGPEIVTVSLEPSLSVTTTQITINGLVPGTVYHVYIDGYQNHSQIFTDNIGGFEITQDLLNSHTIFIQPRESTKFIRNDPSGGDCSSIGVWDADTKTCSLTSDVSGTIQIDSSGITMDGNNHIVSGSGTGAGIYIGSYPSPKTSVHIKNLTVQNFSYGLYSVRNTGVTISGNSFIANTLYGIYLERAIDYYNPSYVNNNYISQSGYGLYLREARFSTVDGNLIDGNYNGLVDCISGGNTISNNTISNSFFALRACHPTLLYSNDVFHNNFINNNHQVDINGYYGVSNVFTYYRALPVGGNYWSSYDEPSEGCNDQNNDELCDSPYSILDKQDSYPWITQNGWLNPPTDGQLDRPVLSPQALPPIASSGFQWPLEELGLEYNYLRFGMSDVYCTGGLHHGTDFYDPHTFSNPPQNTDYPKVYAVADGKVKVSKPNYYKDAQGNIIGGYGDYIIIWHKLPDGRDVYSLYAHLLEGSRRVQQFQEVRRGDWIARQDTTGKPYNADMAEHLHFEIRKSDPLSDAAKCPTNTQSLNQYYYNPQVFISRYWWEQVSISQKASMVTNGVSQETYLQEGTLDPGEQTGIYTAFVPSQQTLLVFTINFQGSTLEVTIYRPNGSIYSTVEISDPPELISIPNPEEGLWGYSIRAVDVPNQDYPYAVSVGFSNAQFQTTGEAFDYDPDLPNTSDTIPPTTILSINPSSPNGNNDWYTTPVEISLVAEDNADGVGLAETRYSLDSGSSFVQYQGPFTIGSEGNFTIIFHSIDGLGNLEPDQTFQFKLDTTPPMANAGGPYSVFEGKTTQFVASGSDNFAGPLSFAWDLNNDGVFETPGQTISFSAEGLDGPESQAIAVRVTDTAGLSAIDYTTLTIENAPPVIDAPIVSSEPSTIGASINVVATFVDPYSADSPFTCTINFGDGTEEILGEISNNSCVSQPHSYSTYGFYPVSVTIQDKDGSTGSNQTLHQVIYNFTGFYQPIDNLPTLNEVKAGSAVPVKFSLSGDQGLQIFADGYPIVQAIACETGIPTDAIEETVVAGGSSLSYDPVTDQYNYIWKTNKAWAGTCRQLIIRLADYTDHVASFKIK